MVHTNKTLGYTIILYPDSAPADWTIQLEQLQIAFCWCLHDKDDAKPHIHVFILGDYPKKKIETIRTAFRLAFVPPVKSCQGMYNYLTHENHKAKYHYSRDSIHHSSLWSQETFETMCGDTQDPQEAFCELIKLVDECGLYEYADLLSYLVSQGDMELLKVARGRDVRDYVTSRRYAVEKGRNQARKRTLLEDCPPKPIEGKPIPINSNEDYNPFLVSDKVDTSNGVQY